MYYFLKMSCSDEIEKYREYDGCRKVRYIVLEIYFVVCFESGYDLGGFGKKLKSRMME